uniref:Centrosomal protein POC5 n=1 Tax=Hemiselmis tepida TaxID=464990 RepID=A0A7S0W6H5_9CRYP|mmetsp:Transcript_6789/g.17366  ORF Transcript_6789/g.17366 Transcript_6789/m.17366 type:complete len:487 (+) Transcript_6789:291-1751(+)
MSRQPGLSVHVQDDDSLIMASPRKGEWTPSPGKPLSARNTPGSHAKWIKVRVGTTLGGHTPRREASTPRRDVAASPGGRLHQSWQSVLNPGSAKSSKLGSVLNRGPSIKTMLEVSDREEEDKRRMEEEERRRIAGIMEEAMRKATAAAARQVEVRMMELSAKERELGELEAHLRAREARLPAQVLDETAESAHMTAISFAELNALRLKLQDFNKQEELRQRVIAQKRLDEKSAAEQVQEKKYMRASEKIMANWRSSSCRKCILAWSEKCVKARQGKAKIHRVLMRMTLRTRATSFARWVAHTKTATVHAERKALEQAAERKFRTRHYASFSAVQAGLRGEEMDEESLIERLKEKDNRCVELEERIEELRASEDALQTTVSALKEEMETHRQIWVSEKFQLTAAIKTEAAAVAEQWQARVHAVEEQRKSSLEKNRKAVDDLELNLREATDKCAEWQAMYNELQSIMDQSVSATPRDRASAQEGTQMV